MTIDEDILEYAARLRCQELHMVVDEVTNLKAVIAIHNTNLGPTLGGCRWREYPSTQQAAIDAIRLAQGMSFKSALAGLPLGGGKAVLLKPTKPIDRVAYFKAFARFVNQLNGRYITAVDSGTSVAEMDIIATETKYVVSTSHGRYSIVDPSILTALGVFQGIRAAVEFKLNKTSLADVHIAVQGLGHVGHELVRLLHEAGARISVFDINQNAIQQCVAEYGVIAISSSAQLVTLDCDVFAPCALGAILNKESIPTIQASIVAGAANNQLEEPEDALRLHERDILYAPDMVINAGGIIYVAGDYNGVAEDETKAKVMAIYDTLKSVFQRAQANNKTTYDIVHDIAMERIYGDNG